MTKEEILTFQATDMKIRSLCNKVLRVYKKQGKVKGTCQFVTGYQFVNDEIEVSYNYAIDANGLGASRFYMPIAILETEQPDALLRV